jgi:hypothetical protein
MPKTIVEYSILSKPKEVDLAAAVQQKVMQGWQPFGSISVNTRSGGTQAFTQAIVKYGPCETTGKPSEILYLQASNLPELAGKVHESLKEGWGPVSALTVTSENHFYQMMQR